MSSYYYGIRRVRRREHASFYDNTGATRTLQSVLLSREDLTVKFLTLVVSIFTFSVVFAEKVVVLTPPIGWRHVPIIVSWVLFSAALAFGGYGLWMLFVAGEIAHGSLVYPYDRDLVELLRTIYSRFDLAGYTFGGGIILLAVSALTKLLQR